jgi:SNF2 family DNA or RNA helicase
MNLAPGLERRFHRLDDGGRGRRGGRLELTVAQKRIAILEAADAPDEIVLVLNYEVLAALEPELRRFNPDFLVFDESWKLKAGRTQTSKAAAALAPLADQLLLLTGSAIGNNVGDLRSQLGLVSAAVPDLRHHADFMADYARTITIQDRDGHSWTKVIGVRQLPRLMAVMEPVWVRATKDVCLRLPPKRPTRVIEFEMPPVMRTLYDAVVRDGEAALGDPLSLASARVVALRLAQITGGHRPDLAPPTEEEEAEGIIRRGRARPIPLDCLKLTWLETIARDAWAGDPTHRVIIWCKHNAEVARIAAMLNRLLGAGRAAAITGATKNAEVDELKAAFNVRNPDGPQVLVCQILKMAFAHNLQAGDHHIYYSHTWSGLAKGQSADRSHRQGRELPIDYTSLVYRGTVEEMALHATDAKEDLNLRLSPVTHRQKIRGNNCQTSFN